MIEKVITVISCDRCKRLVCLREESEYEAFERTWFADLVYDFCPACRVFPAQAQKRNKEEMLDRIF